VARRRIGWAVAGSSALVSGDDILLYRLSRCGIVDGATVITAMIVRVEESCRFHLTVWSGGVVGTHTTRAHDAATKMTQIWEWSHRRVPRVGPSTRTVGS